MLGDAINKNNKKNNNKHKILALAHERLINSIVVSFKDWWELEVQEGHYNCKLEKV